MAQRTLPGFDPLPDTDEAQAIINGEVKQEKTLTYALTYDQIYERLDEYVKMCGWDNRGVDAEELALAVIDEQDVIDA